MSDNSLSTCATFHTHSLLSVHTYKGVGECDCDNQCTGAVVAAVIDAMVVFILVAVIAIITGVTLWRKWKEGMRNKSQLSEFINGK